MYTPPPLPFLLSLPPNPSFRSFLEIHFFFFVSYLTARSSDPFTPYCIFIHSFLHKGFRWFTTSPAALSLFTAPLPQTFLHSRLHLTSRSVAHLSISLPRPSSSNCPTIRPVSHNPLGWDVHIHKPPRQYHLATFLPTTGSMQSRVR